MRSMMVRLCAGLALAAAGVMAAHGQAAPAAGGGGGAAPREEVKPVQPTAPAKTASTGEPRVVDQATAEARRERPGVNTDATVRVYHVQHAHAGELHRVLESVMQALGPMRISTDERTNSLIIAGDEKVAMPKALALLQALDQPREESSQTNETVINVPLSDARAKRVEVALEQLLHESPQRGPGGPPTRVVADENGNSIWLAGEKSRVEQYADYARQMDKGAGTRPNPRRELRYYVLKNADARPLGQTVGQMSSVMGLEAPIVADGSSGTLIAFATKEEHEVITDLVSHLDVPPKRGAKIVEDAAAGEKK